MKLAEKYIYEAKLDKEYLGITGHPEFQKLAAKLAYGDSSAVIAAGQVVTCQSLSGTGALRIGGEFLKRWYGSKQIYVPSPTVKLPFSIYSSF